MSVLALRFYSIKRMSLTKKFCLCFFLNYEAAAEALLFVIIDVVWVVEKIRLNISFLKRSLFFVCVLLKFLVITLTQAL